MRITTLVLLSVASLGSQTSLAAAQSPSVAVVAPYPRPSLDVTNVAQLRNATVYALNNLLSYFPAGNSGEFNQIQVPWSTSGQIWGMFMDYLKWTGDGGYSLEVTNALVGMSYGKTQDFLDGANAALANSILGRWNDDILWPAQSFMGGAEIYGYKTVINASGGAWINVPQKTFDEAWTDWEPTCNGGILWSRDRNSGSSADYISIVTNLEFMQTGARIYIQTGNATAFALVEQTFNWIFSSGLCTAGTGFIADGILISACRVYEVAQWTYNYGSLIGALAWMHKATGNQTYLDLATPFLKTSLDTFVNGNGVLAELCESSANCNRDQMTFKGVYLRNVAYLFRETSDPAVKAMITNMIDSSVNAMMQNSCDVNWNCGGNWTIATGPVYYSQSQAVSAALLVSALAIHSNITGTGLLPTINVAALNTTPQVTSGSNTGSGSAGSGNPYVVSVPLHAAASRIRIAGLGLLMSLGALSLL